jgi:hypothetical protein
MVINTTNPINSAATMMDVWLISNFTHLFHRSPVATVPTNTSNLIEVEPFPTSWTIHGMTIRKPSHQQFAYFV